MAINLFLFIGLSASLILNSTLATYILIKKINNTAAFYYFLFVVAVVMHICGDLFFQLAGSAEKAAPWVYLYWIGFIFMCTFFFLFSTEFPRSRKVIFDSEKTKLFVLIIPIFILYAVFFSTDFIKQIDVSTVLVNSVEYGNLYGLVHVYMVLFLVGGYLILLSEYSKSVESDRHNIRLVSVGTFIAAFFGIIGDGFLLKFFGFGELKLASIFILFSCAIMTYAVVRHKLFIIAPVSEDSSEEKLIFSAQKGKVYSFEEKNIAKRRAFKIFASLVKHNRQGLVVSTIYPEQVRRDYSLPKTPMVWISDTVENGEGKINPKELDALNRSVCLFMESAIEPVVLLEGITPLIIENGSDKIVEFLNSVTKKASETGATVLISSREKVAKFIDLYNEINSIKIDLADLNKKYFSRQVSEEAFIELAEEAEDKIIQKEAECKLVEEDLLGKVSTLSELQKKHFVLDRKMKIINFRIAKRTLEPRIAEKLSKDTQKAIIFVEQQLKRKKIVEEV
jgi:hypothetical protein